MKYNKLSFLPYITIFIYLLTLIFAAVYKYELFLFMLWNLKSHNRVPKEMSFCLLSSAVYSCCLHNVSTWIVKPCRTYLLSFVIISYFLLLFLSRSSHFFFLHFCAHFILSPDSFLVPVIYHLFRLHVYISLIKYYLSPKVSINLCSSISLNVSL